MKVEMMSVDRLVPTFGEMLAGYYDETLADVVAVEAVSARCVSAA